MKRVLDENKIIKSQELLFNALNSCVDNTFFYIVDPKTKIIRWSSSAVDYFNFPSECLPSAFECWKKIVYKDDLDALINDINLVFSGKKKQHRLEYRVLNKYGEYVWIECDGYLSCDENDKPLFFTGMISKIENQNKYDFITKLYNVSVFENSKLKEGYSLLIKISNSQDIIKNYGYYYFNSLLKIFGNNLYKLCVSYNKNVLSYRYHDELFILDSNFKSKDELYELIEKIKSFSICTINEEYNIKSKLYFVFSAYYVDNNEQNNNLVLKRLEQTLQYSLKDHLNELTFYNQKLNDIYNDKLKLERDIITDFELKQNFEFFFQPIIDIKKNKILYSEALLRYKHLSSTYISPLEVIKVLENYDLMVDFMYFEIDYVFKRINEIINIKNIGIGINLTSDQFLHPTFIPFVRKKLEEYHINPKNVVLELTEEKKITSIDVLKNVFCELKKMGFTISIDDFGTGYSNFDLLSEISIDSIKIDQSFIKKMLISKRNIDIIESIIKLSKEFSLPVVVEGVETYEALILLHNMKAEYAQGFYYSKPQDYMSFLEYLKNEDKIKINN